jgi:hypothetical protein
MAAFHFAFSSLYTFLSRNAQDRSAECCSEAERNAMKFLNCERQIRGRQSKCCAKLCVTVQKSS